MEHHTIYVFKNLPTVQKHDLGLSQRDLRYYITLV